MGARFEDALSEIDNAYAARPQSSINTGAALVGGALQVEDAGLSGLVLMRGQFGQSAAAEALTKALKAKAKGMPSIPPEPNQISVGARGALLRLAEDEVLALCDYSAAPALAGALRRAVGPKLPSGFLCEAVSDGHTHLRVQGPGTRDALAKATAIDLHPAVFGAERLRRALIGPIEAVLFVRTRAEQEVSTAQPIEILAPRSQAPTLFRWLATLDPDEIASAIPDR